jgi:hypothetical protein
LDLFGWGNFFERDDVLKFFHRASLEGLLHELEPDWQSGAGTGFFLAE